MQDKKENISSKSSYYSQPQTYLDLTHSTDWNVISSMVLILQNIFTLVNKCAKKPLQIIYKTFTKELCNTLALLFHFNRNVNNICYQFLQYFIL